MNALKSIIAMLCAVLVLTAQAFDTADIHVRDPFIFANEADSTYYLYRSKSPAWDISAERGGVQVLTGRDLKTWTDPVQVLEIPKDNWATGTIWAPEMHKIGDKYYMFATVNDSTVWKRGEGRTYEQRGTQIFVADSPMGPFRAFDDKLPATPMGQMCLDGTYYTENGKHYMVYCHEWVELTDGTVELVELNGEMQPAGIPSRLFCGSAAEWSTGMDHSGEKCYITDGVYLYKSPNTDNLYMIWSSFSHGNYALGVARSKTGKIAGPWVQNKQPLFSQNGGHGMIFRDFDGKLWLVLHGPNNPEGAERMHFFEIEEFNNTLRIKDEN